MSHDQLPSENNSVDTSVPHSGVHFGERPHREFDNTTLAEAHAKGLIETPNSPAKLDKEKMSLGKKAGLALATIGLAGTAGFIGSKLAGGEAPRAEPQPRNPEVSAPVVPGPTNEVEPTIAPTNEPSSPVETSPSAPEVEVVDDTYVSTVNRDPSDEVIAYSLEPVSAETFSREEALVRLMNDLKVYWISGELGSSDTSDIYSPESVALGEQQFDNIFGPAEFRDDDRILPNFVKDTRNHLTDNLNVYTKEFGSLDDTTFNSSIEVLSEDNYTGGDEVFYTVRNEWNSNIHEISSDYDELINADQASYVIDRVVGVTEYQGNYHISYFGFANSEDISEIEK